MKDFAKRNLIIAEGLAENFLGSEAEQRVHLFRAAKELGLDVSDLGFEEACDVLWKGLRNKKTKAFSNSDIKSNEKNADKNVSNGIQANNHKKSKKNLEDNNNQSLAIKALLKYILPCLMLVFGLTFLSRKSSIKSHQSALNSSQNVAENSKPVKKNLGSRWQAKYYNNINLNAPHLIETSHDKISFKWEGHKADKLLDSGRFSARYKSCLTLEQDSDLKIVLGSDDGTKLFINGKEKINNWRKQGYNEVKKEIKLKKGKHVFEIHYFQNGGSSRLEFNSSIKLGKC